MATKYFGEYKDTEGIEFRFEISSTSYASTSSEVSGSCVIDAPEAETIFTPVRGSGMKLSLDADSVQDFSDLWTDNEREWLVTLERDSVEIFRGFINPEGVYQDFVNNEWIIDLDVVDGLGFLENLSYVDSSGVPFSGLQTPLEIIVNCLNRTGITLDIYTAVDLVYTGLSESADVLAQARFKVDRYVRDDGETIMDCKEVISDVLTAFGACICQHNGAWYVYRPSLIMKGGDITFFQYDSDGVFVDTGTQNFEMTIGSFGAGFDPHWCNENQRIYMRNSLGAFRVHYEYGLDDTLFVNEYLDWSGVGGWEGWNELVPADVTPAYVETDPPRTYGAILTAIDSDVDSPADIFQSDAIAGAENDVLTFEFEFLGPLPTRWINFHIELQGVSNTYRLNAASEWVLSGSDVITFNPAPADYDGAIGTFTVKVSANQLPEDGDIIFTFQNPAYQVAISGGTAIVLNTFKVYPTKENVLAEGEFHTVQRTDNPSSKTDEVLKVFHGDNPSNIYYGTIYKADGETNTETWKRKGITESKPLLQILAEDHLRASSVPSRRFEGDIYGYVSYLTTPEIATIPGVYHIMGYSYNTALNQIAVVLRQILTDELADISYELTYDYGETVKPTIRG